MRDEWSLLKEIKFIQINSHIFSRLQNKELLKMCCHLANYSLKIHFVWKAKFFYRYYQLVERFVPWTAYFLNLKDMVFYAFVNLWIISMIYWSKRSLVLFVFANSVFAITFNEMGSKFFWNKQMEKTFKSPLRNF